MMHSSPPLGGHGARPGRRDGDASTDLLVSGRDLGPDECDGYVVLVIDRQLGEVDSYGPYRHAVAERERRRRQHVVEIDALDDVDVQLARFHWPAAHLDVRSTLLHDAGDSGDASVRPRGT